VSTQTARQTTLPTTWLGRTLRLQYVDAFGEGMETSGTLLDLFPFGLVVSTRGNVWSLSSWWRIDAQNMHKLLETSWKAGDLMEGRPHATLETPCNDTRGETKSKVTGYK
jgi:hypothetical protein